MLDSPSPVATPAPPRRRRPSVGRPRLVPLLVVEGCALGALAVLATGAPVALAALPVLAGIALGIPRIRGRRLGPWLFFRLRYRLRHRPGRPAAPAPAVSSHTDRSAATLGVLAYEAALDMVLALTTADAVPMAVLEDALSDTSVPLASIRVVTAYRRGARVQTQVVLRFRPAGGRAAVLARGGGADGARRALSAAATRLARRLGDAGCPARVMGPQELTGAARADVTESWDHCQAAGHRHVGYRIGSSPPAPEAFQAAAGHLPCSGLVSAVLLERAGTAIRRSATVRIVDLAERSTVTTVRRRLGKSIVQLDGEQAAALALTTAAGA